MGIKVISISWGGITWINDYHLSDGTIITCRANEIKEKLRCKNNEQPWDKLFQDIK